APDQPRAPLRQAAPDPDQRQACGVAGEAALEGRAPQGQEALAPIARVTPGGAPRMLAPGVEDARQLGEEGALVEQTQPEVQVLGPAVLLPAARAGQRRVADEGDGRRGEVDPEDIPWRRRI